MINSKEKLFKRMDEIKLARLAQSVQSESLTKSTTLAQLAPLAPIRDENTNKEQNFVPDDSKPAKVAKGAKVTVNTELISCEGYAKDAKTRLTFDEGVSLFYNALTSFYKLQPSGLEPCLLFDDRINDAIRKGDRDELIKAMRDLINYETSKMKANGIISIIPNVTLCNVL